MTTGVYVSMDSTVKQEASHWIEWLTHTNFSFLHGASHPHEMLETAKDCAYAGLAICDFDGAYGLARTYRHWKSMDENTRPALFYGAELHLTQDHHEPVIQQNTIALIARSASGYGHLCQILTRAHRGGKHNAYLSLEDLSSMVLTDLSIIIPMRGLLRKDPAAWESQCQTLKSLFGADDTFMAFSCHLSASEDIWSKRALRVQKNLEIKPLVSLDPFMHDRSRKKLCDMLAAIRTNLRLDEAVAHTFVNDERTLLTVNDIYKRFQKFPLFDQAIQNSKELAARCHFSFAELRYRYPKEMIPPGHTAQSYLTALTWAGAQETYDQPLPPKVRSLIEHELQLIETLGFADYFLTVWDIVAWARKQGILCQGRGSAANSAVCFVLGVTAVDPMKFDLLFERFISVERGDPPDIDVDFEHERREEVIQYIYKRYGREKSAMVANVITFRKKGALRACGKALGIPDELLGQASDFMASRVNVGKTIKDVVEQLKEDSPLKDIPWELWLELTSELKGFPRHLGIHSGGFMIADRPLCQLVPQEPATMEGRTVIQWCKDDIEDLGFFKIDILALGMLSAIRKALSLVSHQYQQPLTLATIPQEDPATYKMIQRADTVGTFQIESRAQMSMLPKLRPKTFYDLVIEVAIIRPGPIQGGMVHPFLRRRHGLEPVTYPDERLRPILHRTLGIPIFQEQVMRIAMAIGDFSPGEANELRKNMGAWSMRGDINPWLNKLAIGMQKNGIAPDFAEAILAQMKGFAEYGFPESHSVSFALLAYASSYLKCHYPAAFFASLLNSQPMGFYSPHALVQAARRQGIAVLPVCVNQSSWASTLEPLSPGSTRDFAIRLGFGLITGLSKKSGEQIERTRKRLGPWTSWEHFLQHTKIPRHDLTALAAANSFAVFGLSRRSAVWIAAAAPHAQWLEDIDLSSRLPEETREESIQQDFASFQTCLYAHPAQFIRDEAWCYEVPTSKLKLAKTIEDMIPNQVITVFGMILIQQRPPSANGMMFITLEDETGFFNLAITPEVLQRIGHKISGQSFLCVSGKLQSSSGAHSILVKDAFVPKISKADVIPIPPQQNTGYPSPAKAAMMNS
jgi:error-prone DNA polymerase